MIHSLIQQIPNALCKAEFMDTFGLCIKFQYIYRIHFC